MSGFARSPTLRRLAVCLVLAAVCATVRAGPIPTLSTQADWNRALASQRIRPVPADVLRAMILDPNAPWPLEYKEAEFVDAYLMPMPHEDSTGLQQPGLVMIWPPPINGNGTPAPNQLQPDTRMLAAWDYVLPGGQDLTGPDRTLEFSVHGPQECMFVSLNLLDTSGNYREWIWHVGTQPGEIPPCVWSDVWVDPVTGQSNFTPTALFTVGAGFDLSNIEFIRFDENGIWSPEFPQLPGAPPLPDGVIWNAWDHVAHMPEPASMALLAASLMGLGEYLRRRRKA